MEQIKPSHPESKSVEELIEEANKSLSASKEMSEQEKTEYDAGYGYAPDEAQPNADD